MPETHVRPATPDDAPTILRFIKGLARFEGEPESIVKTSEDDIRRQGFGPDRYFETLIAEQDGRPVGFALFFHNYSTWEGKRGLYLEDLYVDEAVRGSGAGKALMVALAKLAHERDCARLDLSVLRWNPAREFYRALKTYHQEEWLPYRMDAEQIAALASGA